MKQALTGSETSLVMKTNPSASRFSGEYKRHPHLVLWASALNTRTIVLPCVLCTQHSSSCPVESCLVCSFEICQSLLIRKLSGDHQEVRCSSAAEKRPGLLTCSPRGLPEWSAAECTSNLRTQNLPRQGNSTSDCPAHLGVQWA